MSSPFRDRPHIVRLLSKRLLRDLPLPAWRELFTRLPEQSIHTHSAPAIIVAARLGTPFSGSADELAADAQRIAQDCGGDSDAFQTGVALITFARAEQALEAARRLQELSVGRQLRIGLAAGVCEVASVDVGGQLCTFLVGELVERAQDVSTMAPTGTIRIGAELTADLLQQIENLADRVVATELDDEGVATVSLALPPRGCEDLSSFAGLGLT